MFTIIYHQTHPVQYFKWAPLGSVQLDNKVAVQQQEGLWGKFWSHPFWDQSYTSMQTQNQRLGLLIVILLIHHQHSAQENSVGI